MSEHFGVPNLPLPDVTAMWDGPTLVEELKKSYSLLADYEKESLSLYEPHLIQQQIHQCRAKNVIVEGGNRSGKTLSTIIEDIRCVTNQDPYDKYPKSGLLVLLGKGWKHVGNVFYPMMFKPGAFKIIRDAKTRKWRSYRPWLAEDQERKSEVHPAPPLLSTRFYDPKNIAWECRGQNQFVKITLNTGWEIWAYSSESDPDNAQGFPADRIHIDEDIDKLGWVDELQSRLIDRNGCLWWSAMPHCGESNLALSDLEELAERHEREGHEKPACVKFTIPLTENPHIDEEVKKQKAEEWMASGEDVYRMRMLGERTYDTIQMYPTFNISVHGMRRSELEKGQVPYDWTRFAAIDPGHQVCGVLFGAIPPSDDMVLVYDELYLSKCTASDFGDGMQRKTDGYSFHAFIIDFHGGRLRDIGGGLSVWEFYRSELVKRGVKSDASGSAFIPGCDEIQRRAEAVRMALRVRPNGTPQLRFLVEDNGSPATPNLIRTLKKYHKKTDSKKRVMDEPESRGDCHLPQCLEYLLSYQNLHYIKPPPPQTAASNWELILKQHEAFLNHGKRQEAHPMVHFGPASLVH